MANCHNLFVKFDTELKITSTKKAKLITAKDNLRKLIRNHFAEKHPDYKPKFRLQGSYILGTLIRTKEDTCDLDNGVYFFPKPDVTGTTLQNWVWDAVENATTEKPEHRERCVRVKYKGDFHIDLPVYYKASETNDLEHPFIAVKDNDWKESDPKEFQDWFKERKKKSAQLVRLIKSLKAWCDNRPKKMPNGLTMTVLACNHFVEEKDRDDKALLSLLKAIKAKLSVNWSCIMPTTPKDDVLARFKGDKAYFFESIDEFIADAEKAVNTETNQLKASKLWRSHLGSYFPEGEDANVDSKMAQLFAQAAIIKEGLAKTDKQGVIQTNSGVTNLPHKNFGGDELS